MSERVERVPVLVAAKILGMSPLSVQGALIHRALPIGGAWKNDGSTTYCYHISPHLLSEYTGIPEEKIMKGVEQ